MDAAVVDAAVRIAGIDIWVPRSLFAMRLRKQEWGWERVTTLGVDLLDEDSDFGKALLKHLPESFINLLRVGDHVNGGAFHYPLLQIVDSEGKRTKYYDEYLEYMETVGDG